MNNTHNASIYYSKYIKYKSKYNKFKQLQEGGIKIENIHCGSFGCAYKLTINENEQVNKQVYVLKGVKPDESNMNDMIYKSFVNELLKGIEISALCNRDENKEISKYFCIPIYIPINILSNIKDKLVPYQSIYFYKSIVDFYNEIYTETVEYYKSITKTDKFKILEIMKDININNLISHIFDKICYYVDILFTNFSIIVEKLDINEIKTKANMWYITEYGGNDLFTHCGQNGILNDILNNIDTYEKILKQIHDSMIFLHKHNIYHLDLRPENICYNGQHIKIIDFGFTRNVLELDYIRIGNNNSLCIDRTVISNYYIPPEIYLCLVLNKKLPVDSAESYDFIDFYYMKNTNKIIKQKDKEYIITSENLPYSYNTDIKKYTFNNMTEYYKTYKLKLADYIGVSIGFLVFFTRYACFFHSKLSTHKNKEIFNKLYNMLLSWCIVDYTKRSDKFNDDIKFKLEYDKETIYKYEGVIKPIEEYYKRHPKELNYYEFIYNQLDTIESKK